MTAGNIFTIMMNDGKQDIMLNATEKLLKRLSDVNKLRIQNNLAADKTRFSQPAKPDDRTYAQDFEQWRRNPRKFAEDRARGVHSTMVELAKTHNIFVGRTYKPFAAMSYSYLKVIEKEGQPRFGGDTSFIIPRIGTWVQDMGLHIRLTGLRCTSELDKAKYCAMLGHRLLERVRFMVNGVPIAEYGTEYMNKYFQFHVPMHKRTGWLRNVGQEIPHLAYITPDPKANEYREYRWFGDGPQTLKRMHSEVDLYIPLLFWCNLDSAQAFANCMVPKGAVKVEFKFADLSKLIAVEDYGGGGGYTPPTIQTCDLYVQHINTLPEIESVMMRDYMHMLIRVPKSMSQTLQLSDGAVLLKDLKFPVEHIAVSFRPVENLDDVDLWHRSVRLNQVDVLQPAAVIKRTVTPNKPVLAINWARYFTEEPVVDTVGMKINDIEIHPVDTVKKYSSFHPFAAPGMIVPEDQGWLLFTHQFRNGYDPSGHIDLSRNREIYLHYTSSISDLRKVQLYIEAQAINFLTIKEGSVNLKYYK
jgi:hypothetical protein